MSFLPFKVNYKKYSSWFEACEKIASQLPLDPKWESRNFYGILGDIKDKTTKQLHSYFQKRPGLASKLVQLYLREGINHGYGYQSCSAIAFETFVQKKKLFSPKEFILDVGTGVGTLPGALGSENAHGFDRILEMVESCQQLAQLLGKTENRYWCQDLLMPWKPEIEEYSTNQKDKKYSQIFLGLVLHQLTQAEQLRHVLQESFQALAKEGSLWITLPANSLGTTEDLKILLQSLTEIGFEPVFENTGLICSLENEFTLFWMFVLQFKKKPTIENLSLDIPLPSMISLKQKQSRSKKRERIRLSVLSQDTVLHHHFLFIPAQNLIQQPLELNYHQVRKLGQNFS